MRKRVIALFRACREIGRNLVLKYYGNVEAVRYDQNSFEPP
jgi:hypothetical protein